MKRKLISRGPMIVILLASSAGPALAQRITEFPVPGSPTGITAGPRGDIWFTEAQNNKVGRLTTAGDVTEFAAPGSPGDIVAGPDDNLWFIESPSRKIGQMTRDGTTTEFGIPSNNIPVAITAGPDGNIWSAENNGPVFGGRIGRITPGGEFQEFYAGPFSSISSITAGPDDGNLWFTERVENGPRIGRITPAGGITKFLLPISAGSLGGIAPGPDGNLWFVERAANKIARITPTGVLTQFSIPSPDSGPWDIAAGRDGNLWFTEQMGNRIGRITPAGAITEFAVATSTGNPGVIVAGPDGAMWFTEPSANKIGRIATGATAPGACTPDAYGLCLSGDRFRVSATYSSPHGSGAASPTPVSNSSGFFTFDNPDSVELVVKVLNACTFDPFIWVFAAGLTDQEILLTVTDTKTDEVRTYTNPLGTKFVTVTDTAAFSTCP